MFSVILYCNSMQFNYHIWCKVSYKHQYHSGNFFNSVGSEHRYKEFQIIMKFSKLHGAKVHKGDFLLGSKKTEQCEEDQASFIVVKMDLPPLPIPREKKDQRQVREPAIIAFIGRGAGRQQNKVVFFTCTLKGILCRH